MVTSEQSSDNLNCFSLQLGKKAQMLLKAQFVTLETLKIENSCAINGII